MVGKSRKVLAETQISDMYIEDTGGTAAGTFQKVFIIGETELQTSGGQGGTGAVEGLFQLAFSHQKELAEFMPVQRVHFARRKNSPLDTVSARIQSVFRRQAYFFFCSLLHKISMHHLFCNLVSFLIMLLWYNIYRTLNKYKSRRFFCE